MAYESLWIGTPQQRLAAASSLDASGRDEVKRMLLDGCQNGSWPYGCSTSVNPWIVFIGVSPGNSPAPGDINFFKRQGEPPTFGIPHKTWSYPDGTGFFKKLQSLAWCVVRADSANEIADQEALALAGVMNLDTGASGEAKNVKLKPSFATWVLETTFNRLRPQYVVGLGLMAKLNEPENYWLLDVLTSILGFPFNPKTPPKVVPLRAYTKKRLSFRIWERPSDQDRARTLFVLYPQHPCRSPMTQSEVWDDAAGEFVEIIKNG